MDPELDFRTIQSAEHFAFARTANHNSLLKLGQVEGMQGLAGLQKNVIGHIDHVVDRPQPYRGQPVGQPRGTRPDLHPADDPRRVKRTPRIFELDHLARRFLRDHRRR